MPEQMLISEAAELQARTEFKDAEANFLASVDRTEPEREAALDRLHEARRILVMEFSYSLEALCEVVDGAQ